MQRKKKKKITDPHKQTQKHNKKFQYQTTTCY